MEFINLAQFGWQLVNFLVFYFVVARYVVPPLMKMIHKRQHEIADGLEFASRAKKELEQSEEQRANIVLNAKQEGNKIVEEAKRRAEEFILQAKEEAKLAAIAELAKEKERMEETFAKRSKELDKEVIELALTVLEKSFKTTLGNSNDMVKREVSQLQNVKEYVA